MFGSMEGKEKDLGLRGPPVATTSLRRRPRPLLLPSLSLPSPLSLPHSSLGSIHLGSLLHSPPVATANIFAVSLSISSSSPPSLFFSSLQFSSPSFFAMSVRI